MISFQRMYMNVSRKHVNNAKDHLFLDAKFEIL